MNQFGISFQWRNEHFKPRILLFFLANGSINLPRYWQWLNETCAMMRCSDVGTSANTLAALQREWGNSVQPLKKPTQGQNILIGPDEFHSA
jgi:hypothetical protein